MLDGIVMHNIMHTIFLLICQSAKIYGFGSLKKRYPRWQL
jgi:hypothetical protein